QALANRSTAKGRAADVVVIGAVVRIEDGVERVVELREDAVELLGEGAVSIAVLSRSLPCATVAARLGELGLERMVERDDRLVRIGRTPGPCDGPRRGGGRILVRVVGFLIVRVLRLGA